MTLRAGIRDIGMDSSLSGGRAAEAATLTPQDEGQQYGRDGTDEIRGATRTITVRVRLPEPVTG